MITKMPQKNKADEKLSNLNVSEASFELKDTHSDIEKTFMSEVNQESLDNMVRVGIILPQLKPKLDTVYTVKCIGNLKSFQSEFGKAYSLEIEHNDMRKQFTFNPNGSFHIQLTALLTILKLKLSDLEGKTMIIQKSKGNTKKMKDVELYSVQLKD